MKHLTKTLITGCLLILSISMIQAQEVHFKGEISTQGVGVGGFLNASTQVSGGFAPVNFPEDVYGWGIGVESPLFFRNQADGPNKFTIAPRVSYEYHNTFLPVNMAFRVNALYYTDFEKGALTFRPELGFTMKVSLYILYGYNIPLQNQELIPNRHQVTLGITLPTIDL